MKYTLNDIKHAYFIGIGGVSMSSLASILLINGKSVYGYDMNSSQNTRRLTDEGAIITYSLDSEIPSSVDTVIYTAAIKDDNPLMQKAKTSGAVILSRAELLAVIANSFDTSIGVAGTHGKSTTTGLLSSICIAEDENTAVLSGANLPFLGSSYKCGNGKRIVYEACEYKNSYHSMIPSIKVVLNCEHDHVDFFPTIDDVKNSFRKYIDTTGRDDNKNISVVNMDCKNCLELSQNSCSEVYYYSIKDKADFYAVNIDMTSGYGNFSIILNDGTSIDNISLKIPGIHNVSNSVAAAAAAYLSGVTPKKIKSGLESFGGVSRRFEHLGTYNGATIIDDYAHHPDEIEVTLKAAKALCKGRIICVFQPHTFTRTYELLDNFAKALSLADEVYLCDIYAAREINLTGVQSRHIADKMSNARCPGGFDEIAALLKNELKPDDFCITMGAGEAYKVADILLKQQ